MKSYQMFMTASKRKHASRSWRYGLRQPESDSFSSGPETTKIGRGERYRGRESIFVVIVVKTRESHASTYTVQLTPLRLPLYLHSRLHRGFIPYLLSCLCTEAHCKV